MLMNRMQINPRIYLCFEKKAAQKCYLKFFLMQKQTLLSLHSSLPSDLVTSRPRTNCYSPEDC